MPAVLACSAGAETQRCDRQKRHAFAVKTASISGLVVEYIVAIDVTRVRFPDDALTFYFYFSSAYSHDILGIFVSVGLGHLWIYLDENVANRIDCGAS